MIKQLLFIFLAMGLALGQGSRRDDAALGNNGSPVPFPTVRVCTEGATGVPCSPLATINTDKTVTVAATNPFVGDAFGNFHFYAAPGWYQVQVSGAGVSPYTFIVMLPVDPANSTFTDLTVTGSFNISGSFVSSAFTSAASAPATTGFIRANESDAICWRNNANTGNVCITLNGSDQIVGSVSSTPVISSTANPAATGVLRVAKTDIVCWRNNANTADVCISLNGSDQIVGASSSSPFISATTNPAAAGTLRLAKTDTISWRNNANTADIPISIDTTNVLQVPTISINGSEDISTAPRMTWSTYSTTSMTGTSSYGEWVPSKAIQLWRFDTYMGVAGAGCSTQPVVDIYDGTTSRMATTIANGTQLNSSTSGSPVNVAAGVTLRFRITTAAGGCTTLPQAPSFIAQYSMQ